MNEAYYLHQQQLDLMHFSVGFRVKRKPRMSVWAQYMAIIARFRVTSLVELWEKE